eukprot:9480365-Pyramimonas_sp.AAC.1
MVTPAGATGATADHRHDVRTGDPNRWGKLDGGPQLPSALHLPTLCRAIPPLRAFRRPLPHHHCHLLACSRVLFRRFLGPVCASTELLG